MTDIRTPKYFHNDDDFHSDRRENREGISSLFLSLSILDLPEYWKEDTSMVAVFNFLAVSWSHHHLVKQVLGYTVHHTAGERGTTNNEIIKIHTYEKDYLCS